MADGLDPTKVIVGTASAAGLYVAPVGTTLPTDATTALAAAYKPLGYVAEDGQPTLGQSLSTEDVMAWQSLSALRKILTGKEVTLGFTLMEANPDAMGVYFGTTPPVITDGAFAVDISANELPPEYVAVVDVKDGLVAMRFVLNRATLSENGDTEFSRSAATGFPVTLTGLDDGTGKIATLFVDDGTGAPAVVSVSSPAKADAK